MPEGDKGGKPASTNVRGNVGVSTGGSETVQEKRTVHKKTVFGHETSSDETVVTESARRSGGEVCVELRIEPAKKEERPELHQKVGRAIPGSSQQHHHKPSNGKLLQESHRKPSVHPTSPLPRDMILIASGKGVDEKDADMGVDAREDAERLYQSINDLRKVLGKNGVLPTAATLSVKGFDQVDALKILIQKDYLGQQESSISVSYTDHLGKAFSEGLGEVEITHDNLIKVADAYDKATAAVKEMVTHVKPGQAISQDDISTLVRNTIKKELRGIPMQ